MTGSALRGVCIGSVRSREADMLGNAFGTLRETESGMFSNSRHAFGMSQAVTQAITARAVPDNDPFVLRFGHAP